MVVSRWTCCGCSPSTTSLLNRFPHGHGTVGRRGCWGRACSSAVQLDCPLDRRRLAVQNPPVTGLLATKTDDPRINLGRRFLVPDVRLESLLGESEEHDVLSCGLQTLCISSAGLMCMCVCGHVCVITDDVKER